MVSLSACIHRRCLLFFFGGGEANRCCGATSSDSAGTGASLRDSIEKSICVKAASLPRIKAVSREERDVPEFQLSRHSERL